MNQTQVQMKSKNLVSQAFYLFSHPTNAILVSARQTWLLCFANSEYFNHCASLIANDVPKQKTTLQMP